MNAPLPKEVRALFAKADPYVTLPDVVLPGGRQVKSHLVSRYHVGQEAGNPSIDPNLKPWVNIDYFAANNACAALDAQLQREDQALALAYLIASDGRNWTSGKVGKGKLFQGLRKWRVNGPQAATYEPADLDERRYFYLPDGQIIFDAAGNCFTWIFDNVQGDDRGLVAKPFAGDSPSLVIPYPDRDAGQGWMPKFGANWAGLALIRGGRWDSGAYAGVFSLDRDDPRRDWSYVGFRSTKPLVADHGSPVAA